MKTWIILFTVLNISISYVYFTKPTVISKPVYTKKWEEDKKKLIEYCAKQMTIINANLETQ